MFSLIRAGSNPLRAIFSFTRHVPSATVFLRARTYSDLTDAVRHLRSNAPRPTVQGLRLAQLFVDHGAAPPNKPFEQMTGSELSAWITKAGETTDMPATLPQLTLAERMVEAGAPNADQLQEGMTWRAMTDWLNHAKKYTSYTPGKALPKGRDRDHLASETAKQLARRLSTSCGLQLPYDEYYANKGEVSDFILACRAELMRQGKPAFSPSDEEKNLPATEGQRFKLRTLGVELPEDATREQASDRIIQAQKEGGMTLGPPIQRENVQKARWWGLRTSSSTQKEDPQEPYTPWKSPQQH